MSTEDSSYRQILRSSSLIGGASVLNVLISLLRTKVAAVLLGTTGVGIIGVFTNVTLVGSTLAGFGIVNSGTRQIAEATAHDDIARVDASRRALAWTTSLLGLVGALVLWSLRYFVAASVLDAPELASEVGWLAPAVALTVASTAQAALLNGKRDTAALAMLSVATAVFSTIAGVAALAWLGRDGLVAYVVATPLAAFIVGHVLVLRRHGRAGRHHEAMAIVTEARALVKLGGAFMIAGIAASVGQLVVRAAVQAELRADALGEFQAAWAISMTYIGFVLTAMGTDYFPRLTAAMGDHALVNRLVNEQAEVALLLATPILLGMMSLSPWVITLLYSSAFIEAERVLRFQILGDLLKVASWPLGYILLASGASTALVITEWLAVALFVLATYVLLPHVGVRATGQAFLAMYSGYLALVYALARRRTGFVFSRAVLGLLAAAVVAGASIVALAGYSVAVAAIVGVLLTLAFAAHGLARLSQMVNIGGLPGRISDAIRRRLGPRP